MRPLAPAACSAAALLVVPCHQTHPPPSTSRLAWVGKRRSLATCEGKPTNGSLCVSSAGISAEDGTHQPLSSGSETCFGDSRKETLSTAPSHLSLWAPFWSTVKLPLTGIAFTATLLDNEITHVLPGFSKVIAGIGLAACIISAARQHLFEDSSPQLPDTKVEFQAGEGTIGGSTHKVHLRWASAAMRGWRASMEDAHTAVVLSGPVNDIGFFAVFDGHGGWQVSAIGEQLVRRLLLEKLAKAEQTKDLGTLLTETFVATDEALLGGPLGLCRHLVPRRFHPFSKIGSTCCIALVDAEEQQIVVASAGDSRAVVCCDGEAIALTDDHKPQNPEEIQRIKRAGGRVFRMGSCCRIEGGLNLSRALGDFEYKRNSRLPLGEQMVVATPDIVVQEWTPGAQVDFLIIACDGLFECMARQDVVDYVRNGLSAGETEEEVLRGLLHACCAKVPWDTGKDNETVVLVRWGHDLASAN